MCLTASFPAFPLCAADKIAAVEVEIREVVSEVKQLKENPVDEEGKAHDEWWANLTAARKKEEQLRDEKMLLLKNQAPQGVLNTTHIHPPTSHPIS
jgi:hypothetical protein